jgi:hypothetical protein
MISKESLDRRICDIYDEPGTNTLREWIKECEEEFDLQEKDLDNITDKELTEYIEWLEYLCEK